ncbi:hypothetical protein SynBIOSU31_02477 [Synechococcus sp. BIOS-U3-1]|nr:hypothetical protein SynBIOSU31_02477 [Synechococcus sp. BIOS-U3-1]
MEDFLKKRTHHSAEQNPGFCYQGKNSLDCAMPEQLQWINLKIKNIIPASAGAILLNP